MANFNLILQELRVFDRQKKEQLEMTEEERMKANTRGTYGEGGGDAPKHRRRHRYYV